MEPDFAPALKVAQALFENGDLPGCLRAAESLLCLTEVAASKKDRSVALFLRGACRGLLRSGPSATGDLVESAALGLETGLLDVFANSKWMLGLLVEHEQPLAAITHWTEAVETLRGSPISRELVDALHIRLDNALAQHDPAGDSVDVWIGSALALGDAYLDLDRPADAQRLGEMASTRARTAKDRRRACFVIGAGALLSGAPVKAVSAFESALSLAEEMAEDSLRMGVLLQNLSQAYKDAGALRRSISSLERADSMLRQRDPSQTPADPILRVSNLISLGAAHRERGSPSSARPYLNKAVELASALPGDRDEAQVLLAVALTNLGLLDSDEGKFEAAVEKQKRALAIYQGASFSYPRGLAQVDENLGAACFGAGLLGQAEEYFRAALDLNQQIGNLAREFVLLVSLAEIAGRRQRWPEAETLLQRALGVARRTESLEAVGQALYKLGQVRRWARQFEQAAEALGQSADLFRSLARPGSLAMVLSESADLAVQQGDLEKALAVMQETAECWRKAGMPRQADHEELRRMEVSIELGRTDAALALMPLAERLAEYPRLAAWALLLRGRVFIAIGRPEEAVAAAESSLARTLEEAPGPDKAIQLVNVGKLLAEVGRAETAKASYEAALPLLDLVEDSHLQGFLWEQAGRFFKVQQNDNAVASVCFHHALAGFRRSGDDRRQAEMLYSLGIVSEGQQSRADAIEYLQEAAALFKAHGEDRRLLDCRINLGVTFLNAGVLHRAWQELSTAARMAMDLRDETMEANVLLLMAETARRLENDGAVEPVLQQLEGLVLRSADPSIRDRLFMARMLLAAESGQMVSASEWQALAACPALAGQRAEIEEIQRRPDVDEKKKGLASLLRFVLFGQREDVLSFEAPRLFSSTGVVDFGVSRTSGWARGRKGEPSAMLALGQGFTKNAASEDPDRAALDTLISAYHDLGVWEDPNLGLFTPILRTYSDGTRFERRVMINPLALTEGCLHFYFYRADPLGKLAPFLSNCVFVGTGNVVFCSLPFLEGLMGLMPPMTVSEEVVRAHGIGVLKTWQMAHAAFGRFLIEWVIAHEIGHAVLGHSSLFLASSRFDRDYERAADEFFVNSLADEASAGPILLSVANVLIHVYHERYRLQYGHDYEGREMVTLATRIDIVDDRSAHPDFLLRLLDLADRILERFPDLDQTGYYGKVRTNIHVMEEA